MKKETTNWRNLLNRWISGEADRSDERSLEALAKDDPFLADALEGYRSLPEADHARSVTKVKANLRKRTTKKERGAVFYLARIAAMGVVLLGAWLVFRAFDGSVNQAMSFNVRQEEALPNAASSNTSPAPIALDSISSEGEDQFISNISDTDFKDNTEKFDFNKNREAAKNKNAVPPPKPLKDIQKAVVATKEGNTEKPENTFEEQKARMEAEAGRKLATRKKMAEEESKLRQNDDAKKTEDALADQLREQSYQFNNKAADAVQADEIAVSEPTAAPVESVENAPVLFDTIDDVAAGNVANTSQTIKGRVTDANGEPLIGASIVVSNTGQGALTDIQGDFTINSPFENPSLFVSYTGFQNKEVQVSGEGFLDIQLSEGAQLSEVVVTGLSSKKQEKKVVFEPKGGFKKFGKYVKQNLRMPQAAIDAGIKGEVEIGFTLNSSGRPTNFKAIRSLGHGCDEEAIRLLKEGPKWNGIPSVQHRYTFEFK